MDLSPKLADLARNDLPTSLCPTCHGRGRRHLPEAGKILRAKRVDAGLRLRTMARELQVSPQTIADWESGRRLVPHDVPERWERVCRQLGRVLAVRREVATAPAATAAPKEPPLREETADVTRRRSVPPSQPRAVANQPQGWERMLEQREPKAHLPPLPTAAKAPEAPGWERMLENQR